MIYRYEFENRTGSHFKSYIVQTNTVTLEMSIDYGRIGGARTRKDIPFYTASQMDAEVDRIRRTRLSHGYTEVTPHGGAVSFDASPVSVASSSDFAADLRDMQLAERSG